MSAAISQDESATSNGVDGIASLISDPLRMDVYPAHIASLVVGTGIFLAGAYSMATCVPVNISNVRYIDSWTSGVGTFGGYLPVASSSGTGRSGVTLHDAPPADQVAAIRWLHDESGLTWDQLGRVFGVSRRAVHHWANGGRMNAHNAEALAEFISVVRELPASGPNDRRALLLFDNATHGRSVIDGFRARQSSGPGDVSGTPFTPDQLLGALHDE